MQNLTHGFYMIDVWRFAIIVQRPRDWTWKVWEHVSVGWMPKRKSNAQVRKERDDYGAQINRVWAPALMEAANHASWYASALCDIRRMDDVAAIHRRVQDVFDLVHKRDAKETA